MKTGLWALVIIIVLLAGTGIYLLTQGTNNSPNLSPSPNPNPNPSPNPSPNPTPQEMDKMGAISNNHGHTVDLHVAEQDAGQAVVLTLTTGAGHTHTLSLTAAQVQDIKAGKTVSVTSSVNSGHSHLVTFN